MGEPTESAGRVEFTWFLDRSLGRRKIARVLREAGLNVETHFDHFSGEVPDDEWLAFAGSKGWIALGKDQNIKRSSLPANALARESIRRSETLYFACREGNVRAEMSAESILLARPTIERLAASRGGPLIGKIYKNGRVVVWDDFGRGID